MDENTLARFLAKVEKQDEVTSPHVSTPCWLWTAYRSRKGYGTFRVGSYTQKTTRKAFAHRLAFARWVRDPGLLFVCHRCDVRACVNPEHLWLGDHDANMADKRAKRRGAGAKGESHWCARLTRSDVLVVRRQLAAGVAQRTLAEGFEISPELVSNIATRSKWRHIKDESTAANAYTMTAEERFAEFMAFAKVVEEELQGARGWKTTLSRRVGISQSYFAKVVCGGVGVGPSLICRARNALRAMRARATSTTDEMAQRRTG